ncbi:MAG TPA: UvrB/UvrC motif-containing protein, partial [Candidatus Acidoferrum sp.]|nr:UvrB/UvrC motif-containing protein [Candidatus Acidoferrum sp.]
LIQTRARASEKLAARRYADAARFIDAGINALRQFFTECGRNDAIEQSQEVAYLENWKGEINSKRPLTRREKLELALHEAVRQENYEKAAEVRDALRKLESE